MIVCQLKQGDRARLVKMMETRMRQAIGNSDCRFDYWMPKTGIGAFDNGVLRAGIAVYFEFSSPVAVAGFCIANPDNTPQESYRAISLLLDALPGYAKRAGAKRLLTIFGNRGINRMLDRKGFTGGEAVEEKMLFLE